MPKYYFHVQDGHSTPDREGTELESFAEAKCEAVKLAGRIICDDAAKFWNSSEWSLTVTDDSGLALCTLHIVGTEAPSTHRQDHPGGAPA